MSELKLRQLAYGELPENLPEAVMAKLISSPAVYSLSGGDTGGVLYFTKAEIDAFLAGARAGEFDDLAGRGVI